MFDSQSVNAPYLSKQNSRDLLYRILCEKGAEGNFSVRAFIEIING
jgi:hypothetical protein